MEGSWQDGDAGLSGKPAKTLQMNTMSAAGRSLLAGSLMNEEVSQEELLVSLRKPSCSPHLCFRVGSYRVGSEFIDCQPWEKLNWV